jgi:O-antigen ligase
VISKTAAKLTWLFWVMLVIVLPITTFPLVMKLTGSSSVAPASLLILLPLVVIAVPLAVAQKNRQPVQLKAVLVFFIFAIATIAMAFLRPLPDYKDQSLVRAALEGVVTLILGLFFYLVAVLIPNKPGRIDTTLRILNWSGLGLVLVSILQVATSQYLPAVFNQLEIFRPFFSPTRILTDRMLGFASEPSWLAHMLNLVYLAYWLAAVYTRKSVHRFKLGVFIFEDLLLALGVLTLVGSLSRGGLMAFMMVIGFIFLLLNFRLITWIVRKYTDRGKVLTTAGVSLVLLIVYLGLIISALWGFSRIDPRMEEVFQFSKDKPNPLLAYADNLQFGERVIYWQTGWNIFNDHPVIGVGVGLSGFYFPQYLPDVGWELVESRKLLYQYAGLMNIKNLWSRLLAETGIVGFALFVNFLVLFGFTSSQMVRRGVGRRRTLGFMGLFMLVALIAEELSVDSFALPYLWFTMGLVTAAWKWYDPAPGEVHG